MILAKPALRRRLAAPLAVSPDLQTSPTGRALAGARTLFSGSNWAICTFFAPAMWPFSKSAAGRRSTTRASSRLIMPVSCAGPTRRKPLKRPAISL